ncbi:MAG: adenylate/guanylate cyclase domain-containing protein [Spirochaetaceae bacterium]|nr:MAG: adenylate/guanylate cyclase domain-containing protein [Spirochaetaceae bacterium]
MKDFMGLKDGDTASALVCVTDIADFTRTASSLSLEGIAGLLKQVSSIIARRITNTGGRVVKYIGDASLLVFPQEDVDGSIRELLSMKQEIEEYFASTYPALAITFSAHLGQIIIVRIEPFENLDILGHTVNTAWRLGARAQRGGFVISQPVYDALEETTRVRFHRITPQAVYVAG